MHDAKKLRELFTAACEDTRNDWQANKADQAIEMLADAITELRAAGIQVELELQAAFGRRSYDMVHALGSNGSAYVHAFGLLKIDNQEYLLAIGAPTVPKQGETQEKRADTARIYLSSYDITQQGGSEKITTESYEILTDPDAIGKFQEQIVEHSARNSVLEDIDKERAVTRQDRGRGPVKSKSSGVRIG